MSTVKVNSDPSRDHATVRIANGEHHAIAGILHGSPVCAGSRRRRLSAARQVAPNRRSFSALRIARAGVGARSRATAGTAPTQRRWPIRRAADRRHVAPHDVADHQRPHQHEIVERRHRRGRREVQRPGPEILRDRVGDAAAYQHRGVDRRRPAKTEQQQAASGTPRSSPSATSAACWPIRSPSCRAPRR